MRTTRIDDHLTQLTRLRFVNAGHNPPYLARKTEGGVEITELEAGGPPLGLFPEIQCKEAELELPHPRMLERGFVVAPLRELVARPRFQIASWAELRRRLASPITLEGIRLFSAPLNK